MEGGETVVGMYCMREYSVLDFKRRQRRGGHCRGIARSGGDSYPSWHYLKPSKKF